MSETELERRLKERCMRYETKIEQLTEANDCLMIGIQGCAIPHEGERKVLQEAVDMARNLVHEGQQIMEMVFGFFAGIAFAVVVMLLVRWMDDSF